MCSKITGYFAETFIYFLELAEDIAFDEYHTASEKYTSARRK